MRKQIIEKNNHKAGVCGDFILVICDRGWGAEVQTFGVPLDRQTARLWRLGIIVDDAHIKYYKLCISCTAKRHGVDIKGAVGGRSKVPALDHRRKKGLGP